MTWSLSPPLARATNDRPAMFSSGVARFEVVVRPIFGRSMRTRGGCGASPPLSLPFARSAKFCDSRHIMVPSEAFSLQFLGVACGFGIGVGAGCLPRSPAPSREARNFATAGTLWCHLRRFLYIFVRVLLCFLDTCSITLISHQKNN